MDAETGVVFERGRADAWSSARKSRTRPLVPPNPKDDETPADADRVMAVDYNKETPADEPIQAPLIPDADTPALEAKAIVNDRMAATYVGLSLSRGKDGEKLCSLEFSLVLTREHDPYIPEKIAAAHSWLRATDNKAIQVNHIEAQTLDLYDAPKSKKPLLHIVAGAVEKVSVAMIEENGKGKTKKVIRFVFRLKVERAEDVIDFAAWNDETEFWIDMNQTQGNLLAVGAG